MVEGTEDEVYEKRIPYNSFDILENENEKTVRIEDFGSKTKKEEGESDREEDEEEEDILKETHSDLQGVRIGYVI